MSASYQYQVGGAVKTVAIERQGDELRVNVGDTTYQVIARADPTGRLDLIIDGQRFSVYTTPDPHGDYVWLGGKGWRVQQPTTDQQRSAAAANKSTGSLTTAMPGLVTAILVQEGDQVQRGAILVILEAMKMEQRITAPYTGRVSKLACTVGQVVTQETLLVEISSED